MVRICDGRMSGTAYGTVVSARDAGGRRGWPACSRPHRRRHRARCRRPASWTSRSTQTSWLRVVPIAATVDAYASPTRGWEQLYVQTVQQANIGADLDFLRGSTGDKVSRESH